MSGRPWSEYRLEYLDGLKLWPANAGLRSLSARPPKLNFCVAIKLDADENVEQGLHIGEGIETCLAGRQLDFKPCWALGSAGAIRGFPVLSGIEALTGSRSMG